MHNDIKEVEIVILGAGLGGLGMAAQLKRQGIDDFIIIDRCSDIGGVWLNNTYPGAACDTESHLYCYSFHLHLRVSAMYAGRDELLAYINALADRFDLRRHLRLSTEVLSAQWLNAEKRWLLTLSDGEAIKSRFFIASWGQLNTPYIPDFRGFEQFSGKSFHSAHWRHDISLKGKRVASIGNAASAVQYVPEIAPEVAHLTVYQRSANWIVPRNQEIFTPEQLDEFSRDPELFQQYRQKIHLMREVGAQRLRHGTVEQAETIAIAKQHLAEQVNDSALREKLVPDYEIGCKRILRSDEYYPALMRDNVLLQTKKISHFNKQGIVTTDGKLEKFDVVIFGTGFQSQSFQGEMQIIGTAGSLQQKWADGAEAYLGITVPDFPNMFLVYGPNTNLNHSSIISMMEIQHNYILDAIGHLRQRSEQAIAPKHQVFMTYNEEVQKSMQGSAFSSTCSSWYKNAAGKVINNWPGSVEEYRQVTQWHEDDFIWSGK